MQILLWFTVFYVVMIPIMAYLIYWFDRIFTSNPRDYASPLDIVFMSILWPVMSVLMFLIFIRDPSEFMSDLDEYSYEDF